MTFDPRDSGLTIGVIGSGTMGRGIVQIVALAGMRVWVFDAKPGAAEEAKGYVAKMLARLVEKQSVTAEEAAAAVARIELARELADFARCQLVIEAIVEDLTVKRQLFAQLDAILGGECILATNTSSLSVTAIASTCKQPERVAGFHFFNPVPLMKLVEVIAGVKSEPWVTEALVVIADRIGRKPVLVKDSPGFLVNHIGRAYVPEALRVLGEGIAQPHDVDQVMREAAGFRMGPFELMDLVGADVAHPVMESIYQQYFHEPMYQPSPIAQLRMAGGSLGRKTQSGFYRYENNQPLAPPAKAVPVARPTSVWVSAAEPEGHVAVTALLGSLGVKIESGARASDRALCVVTPIGRDATTAAIAENLDPRRSVAIDTLFPLQRRRTLMVTPVTDDAVRDAAHGLFASDGVPVTVINDSPGFIAQRIAAMIVNVGCNIAQQRVASPADIDVACKLGLNYPFGPLELGDRLEPRRVLRVLENLHAFYCEPRYRPMPWLRRRAMLGVSLLTPESLQ